MKGVSLIINLIRLAMKNIFGIVGVILLIILVHSCETDDANAMKDGDGNVYTSVKIGTQEWLTENLKTTRYLNGDLIGTTSPATLDISAEATPKYQWAPNGNESNVTTYGRLYTWYAVTDSRNVCPDGWHVPTDAEWTTLTDYLTNNGYGYEGIEEDIAKSMAARSGWSTSPVSGTIGNDQPNNNSCGFTALPCGHRDYIGEFDDIGSWTGWWSSTEGDINTGIRRQMLYSKSIVDVVSGSKLSGFSVRCIKD
jgi:uncharacterized protein (TIGR02145 family)